MCGVESGWLAGLALLVRAPREHAALSVDGGDPAGGFGGLRILLVLVVRALGGFSGLPGPDAAILAGDHSLLLVGCNPAGFQAFRQADGCEASCAAGLVIGVTVRVQEEIALVESLDLDDTRARVLFKIYGLGFSGVVRIPCPGLPVRVHDEGLAGGGGGGNGLRLSGQAGCGLLCKFRILILTVGLTGPESVDPSLPVHGQEPVIVHADAREPSVSDGIEDGGRCLSAGPGVNVLVGSERGLPSATGFGLQIMEAVGSLGGERNLHGCAVFRPCIDAAVAGQADHLLSCGLDIAETWLLSTG